MVPSSNDSWAPGATAREGFSGAGGFAHSGFQGEEGLRVRGHLIHIAIYYSARGSSRGSLTSQQCGYFSLPPRGPEIAAGSSRRIPNARECLGTSPALISWSGG